MCEKLWLIMRRRLSKRQCFRNVRMQVSEAILCADFGKGCEFGLYLGPGELSNDTVVHDEKLLLFRVRGPWSSSNALKLLSRPGLFRWSCLVIDHIFDVEGITATGTGEVGHGWHNHAPGSLS